MREFVYLLAQLYYQEAAQSEKSERCPHSFYDKADKALVRWLKISKPTTDALLIHSQILYSWAAQDPDKPDLELIKRALKEIDAGMLLATHPKDTYYVLKLVCLQQLGKMQEAAELLELIVKPETGFLGVLAATCRLLRKHRAVHPRNFDLRTRSIARFHGRTEG